MSSDSPTRFRTPNFGDDRQLGDGRIEVSSEEPPESISPELQDNLSEVNSISGEPYGLKESTTLAGSSSTSTLRTAPRSDTAGVPSSVAEVWRDYVRSHYEKEKFRDDVLGIREKAAIARMRLEKSLSGHGDQELNRAQAIQNVRETEETLRHFEGRLKIMEGNISKKFEQMGCGSQDLLHELYTAGAVTLRATTADT